MSFQFVFNKVIQSFFCIVLLLASATYLFSQEIKVSATLDSNSILIGEQTKLHLTVKYKADQGTINIQWPNLSDTIIKQVEIVEKSKIGAWKLRNSPQNLTL